MATKKTNSFYIRETVDVDGTTTNEDMDLSIYVDPVNKQGLLIRQADFIWFDSSNYLPLDANADWQAAIQLHDTTLGGLVDPENTHQIASGSLMSVSGSSVTKDEDFFPDRLGMAKGEGRIVVNDSMEISTLGNNVPGNLQVCVVLEVQVVKLSEKDYISLALQSVADA